MLTDGQIAGTWSHEGRDRAARIQVRTFGRLSRTHRTMLIDETDRLATYLGAPPDLSIAATT